MISLAGPRTCSEFLDGFFAPEKRKGRRKEGGRALTTKKVKTHHIWLLNPPPFKEMTRRGREGGEKERRGREGGEKERRGEKGREGERRGWEKNFDLFYIHSSVHFSEKGGIGHDFGWIVGFFLIFLCVIFYSEYFFVSLVEKKQKEKKKTKKTKKNKKKTKKQKQKKKRTKFFFSILIFFFLLVNFGDRESNINIVTHSLQQQLRLVGTLSLPLGSLQGSTEGLQGVGELFLRDFSF